jgi:hypothetical protein
MSTSQQVNYRCVVRSIPDFPLVVQVIFSAAVIGTFAYIVYQHFKIDGPLWQAVVLCAAESPLFVVPLCMVPKLRDAFVSIYARGLPGGQQHR